MTASRSSAFRAAALLAGMGLIFVLGCGDDTGLGKRYPVSGKVTYDGKPVEKGRIDFVSTSGGRAASGDIVNGEYTLTTATPKDGALPGSYKVTIASVEVDTSQMEAVAKGGQFHHDKTFAKAVASAKKLVPSKYALADTSGLTAEVKEQSNKFDFDLKD